MTPIRVRGKRTATKEEKWHAGKQRKPYRHGSASASDRSSSNRSTSSLAKAAARKARRRTDPTLSRLEQLPTEMLQSIFEFSANVDLPLVSPRLSSQLTSGVLQQQLTSQVLHQALETTNLGVSSVDVAHAMRLMNSRFFTWPFFQAWLHSEFDRLAFRKEWEDTIGENDDASVSRQRQEEWTWYRLRPSPSLPPPSKLLRRPFTADRVRFLKFMIATFRDDPESLDAVYCEFVQDGFHRAVEDGAGDALSAFFCLGAQIDTELLRKAVIDAGCVKDVVQRLISRTTHLTSEPLDVDFLDPALWAWAEKARAKGDEAGSWLVKQLRTAARDSGQGGGSIGYK